MRELGYLDDADFARRWVANRAAIAPRGERMLELELRQKGVKSDVAREAIAEADLNELEAAREVARTRLGRLRDLDLPTQRRRMAAFLGRRGFSSDTIRALDRELFTASDEDDSESGLGE
jgi:regulatory protein